jgi:hypothetical protein
VQSTDLRGDPSGGRWQAFEHPLSPEQSVWGQGLARPDGRGHPPVERLAWDSGALGELGQARGAFRIVSPVSRAFVFCGTDDHHHRSEFGMQGYPDMRTVETWDDDKTQLFPQSRVSVNHNKADGFERRLELYLMENFRHAFDMESYVYYTQIMQAECLAAAYRLWRREWRGKGKEYTAGALVWQVSGQSCIDTGNGAGSS